MYDTFLMILNDAAYYGRILWICLLVFSLIKGIALAVKEEKYIKEAILASFALFMIVQSYWQ